MVLVLAGVLGVLALGFVVVTKVTGVDVREPTSSCDLLSREEASAVVGELDSIAGGSFHGLPACAWAGRDGRVLTASAAPGDLWASRLPLSLGDLEDVASAEQVAAVDAFRAVVNSTPVDSPEQGCDLYSEMLTTVGGRAPGTTRVVDVVTARAPGVSGSSCTRGEWAMVVLQGGPVSGTADEQAEVERLLELVDRQARALPAPELVRRSGIVVR